MTKRFASIVGSSVAAALIWLASVGSANAILVRGGIDPAFDLLASGQYAALSDLYWTAEIQFNVDANCLSPGNDVTCVVSGLDVTGRLSSISTPSNFQDVTFFTSPGPNSYSLDLRVNGSGQVTGVANDVSPLTTNVPFGFAGANIPNLLNGNTWVQFDLAGDAQLIVALCEPLTQPDNYSRTHSRTNFFSTSSGECGPQATCVTSTDPTTGNSGTGFHAVTFTQVPEPGSLWLILAALSAGWLTLRPRRRLA
jgi:hypothetical protein